MYVVVDGGAALSPFGRRLRHGRPWLEPYFSPGGVCGGRKVEAPVCTPTAEPPTESVTTEAAGNPAACCCIVVVKFREVPDSGSQSAQPA